MCLFNKSGPLSSGLKKKKTSSSLLQSYTVAVVASQAHCTRYAVRTHQSSGIVSVVCLVASCNNTGGHLIPSRYLWLTLESALPSLPYAPRVLENNGAQWETVSTGNKITSLLFDKSNNKRTISLAMEMELEMEGALDLRVTWRLISYFVGKLREKTGEIWSLPTRTTTAVWEGGREGETLISGRHHSLRLYNHRSYYIYIYT